MSDTPPDPRAENAESSRLHLQHDTRIRLRAGLISLAVGVVLLWVKFLAYHLTGSTAVLSDALESIVNVVAALFAIGSLLFAGRPADRNHPYGHGKIEYFAATFEGGLITFAAIMIIYEAVQGFFKPPELRQLDLGLMITFAAGVANAALGWFLIRTGKATQSLTLIADGKHVLSDFWTSLGVIGGLLACASHRHRLVRSAGGGHCRCESGVDRDQAGTARRRWPAG